ncbi:hypothetical protein GCM10029978_040410 [Actinoallomurus acanthiterrae]
MGGAAGQPEGARDLADSEAPGAAGKEAEDRCRSLDRLHGTWHIGHASEVGTYSTMSALFNRRTALSTVKRV